MTIDILEILFYLKDDCKVLVTHHWEDQFGDHYTKLDEGNARNLWTKFVGAGAFIEMYEIEDITREPYEELVELVVRERK